VWETGARPERDESGRGWRIADDMGLVLTLIPGATFEMGASREANAPNFDAEAQPEEAPVHRVTLAPYFISKYEMTQGQWQRLTGKQPTDCSADPHSGVPPVADPKEPANGLNRTEAIEVLARLGLLLPTEAQWEYAARGGVDAPWWVGREKSALATAANLLDLSVRGRTIAVLNESWNDGYAALAPIGRFRPNPFGLHDVIGNVFEWCRDDFGSYSLPVEEGSGLRLGGQPGIGIVRGGSNFTFASAARSTYRLRLPAMRNANDIGVRPVRAIEE
jgi:formylglycine-generating enzyme required for sulfatase activity